MDVEGRGQGRGQLGCSLAWTGQFLPLLYSMSSVLVKLVPTPRTRCGGAR